MHYQISSQQHNKSEKRIRSSNVHISIGTPQGDSLSHKVHYLLGMKTALLKIRATRKWQ